MVQNSLIQVRVDEELKVQAERLFRVLGIDMATAIRLFLTQAVMKNSIPFPITANNDPNETINISTIPLFANNDDEIEMPSEINVFDDDRDEIEIINDEIIETYNDTDDSDFLMYPTYNDPEMKQLRADLKKYVANKYPKIKFIDACNWAFFVLNPKHNQYLKIDFWQCFLDRDFDLCHQRLFEYGQHRRLMNPKNDSDSYIRSMMWLDEYFEEVHGGVANYLKKFEVN